MTMTERQQDQAWVEADRAAKLAAANARETTVSFSDQVFIALRDSIVREDGSVPFITVNPDVQWGRNA